MATKISFSLYNLDHIQRINNQRSFRDTMSRKPTRKYSASVSNTVWSKIKWQLTLSVAVVLPSMTPSQVYTVHIACHIFSWRV